jgi:hypothetical protein
MLALRRSTGTPAPGLRILPLSHRAEYHDLSMGCIGYPFSFEIAILSSYCWINAPIFIYGFSSKDAIFGASVGEPINIDCLIKINVKTLIRRGIERRNNGLRLR